MDDEATRDVTKSKHYYGRRNYLCQTLGGGVKTSTACSRNGCPRHDSGANAARGFWLGGTSSLYSSQLERLDGAHFIGTIQHDRICHGLARNPYRPVSSRQPGHAGLPLPSVQVRLVDESTGQSITSQNITPGAVQVKGPTVFTQYLNGLTQGHCRSHYGRWLL
jgi:acyl-CoA synthetase (AMP-forming)/AMP-acid ligase II